MALIDFKCSKCGEEFFEIINIKDVDKIKCPKCGSSVMRVYKGKHYGKSCDGGSKCCGGSCGSCSGCH